MTYRGFLVIALLVLGACGGSGGARDHTGGAAASPSTSAGVACASPPEATAPDVATSLGLDENHETFCIHGGQRVSVFLSVPLAEADTGKWAAIQASDTAVLQAVPSGALTLVRGVTAGIFAARRAGTCRLSSTRPTGQAWEAEIVVQ
jgi:hypothetical protein